jgi:peptidoglycan/xylan/chitin deacetylase (PgdA/CDA1 family)
MKLLRLTGLARLPALARRGFGTILTLHHIGAMEADSFAPNRGLKVTPEFLDSTLAWLGAHGYRFVTLAELHDRLVAGDTAEGQRLVALTLDDGYRNNRDVALPVFARHGAPFTVFVTTGFVERHAILWWEVLAQVLRRRDAVRFDFGAGPETLGLAGVEDKCRAWHRFRAWAFTAPPTAIGERIGALAAANDIDGMALTAELTLDRNELIDFARHPLVTIGAHTETHPALAALTPAAALAEMRGSADKLQSWLGQRPRFLAYPYGFRSAAGRREFALAAEAGFDLAVTTRPGMLFPAHRDHRTALPRVSLNGDFQSLDDLDVLMSGAPFMLKNGFRTLDVA